MTSETVKVPIALQLYSVRRECQKSLPETLSAVARMGYDGVEFAGYYDYSAKDLRKMLDDVGLKVAGTHIGLEPLQGDALKETVEFSQELGNDFLIVSWIEDDLRDSADAWLRTAGMMEEIADKLAGEGMFTGLHNHGVEFETFDDGKTGWDLFFANTSKSVMQMDMGNALRGGADPLAFMKKYPHRQQSVHLKEYSVEKGFVPIGEGDIDWAGVLEFCTGAGDTQWYVMEFENQEYPAIETVDKCLKTLREIGF